MVWVFEGLGSVVDVEDQKILAEGLGERVSVEKRRLGAFTRLVRAAIRVEAPYQSR